MKYGVWLAGALLGGLLALAWFGGALNWNREAPYELVQSWGGPGTSDGRFNEPTGIAVGADEVFVSDARNRRIQVFDKQGRFLRAFNEGLERPMNLEWHDGRLYVADFFADQILVYQADGKLLHVIAPPDGLHNPGGVAVRPDGALLVADTYAHRVLLLGPDGKVLKAWGTPGETGSASGEFNYPADVTLAPDGGFYVADGYNDRVQQFDAQGNFVRKWGGPFGVNLHGPFKGWFATATSIAYGPNDKVFVADFYHDRVQKFCDHGGYITSFGAAAPDSATHTAIAVDVDSDGGVWVANYARHRVEQWRPSGAARGRS